MSMSCSLLCPLARLPWPSCRKVGSSSHRNHPVCVRVPRDARWVPRCDTANPPQGITELYPLLIFPPCPAHSSRHLTLLSPSAPGIYTGCTHLVEGKQHQTQLLLAPLPQGNKNTMTLLTQGEKGAEHWCAGS